MNIRLLLNGTSEDLNTFRRYFQESLRAFNPKAQVQKSNLQSCPDPSKVGTNTLLVNFLVKNVLDFIKQEIGPNIKVATQSELAFFNK